MGSNIKKGIILIFIGLAIIVNNCSCLRCENEDGPSKEDVLRVHKMCMRKIGSTNNQDNRNGGNDNDDDDYDYQQNNENNNNNNNNNRNNNHYNKYPQQAPRRFKRLTEQKLSRSNNNQWMHDQNQSIDGNMRKSKNMTSTDGLCFFQCFFQEFKMTNQQGFPDKHKALQTMTKDVRSHEFREFLTDTIQECFRIIEMDQSNSREKCNFSNILVSCMDERAKANCDDYHNFFVNSGQ